MQLICLEPHDVLRSQAENLIRLVYAESFGATVEGFPHWMVGMANGSGKLGCAAGLRLSWENCFSACYLDEPVTRILQRRTGMRVSPGRILEVTTLAGTRGGDAFQLVDAVGDIGRAMGMSCAVFTATARLRRALQRNGFELVPLTPARSERVADPSVWGSYYETDPWVCALLDQGRTATPDVMAPLCLESAAPQRHTNG